MTVSEGNVVPGQELRHVDMQWQFYNELSKVRANAAKTVFFLTEDSNQKLVDDVKKAKTTIKKEPWDYWLVKHYDVLMVEN